MRANCAAASLISAAFSGLDEAAWSKEHGVKSMTTLLQAPGVIINSLRRRPMPFTSLPPIVLSVGCLCFLIVSAIILGDYQDWGGDFAQYVTHARNLLWGRPWSFSMEGYPAVMPGYPALLSLLYLLGGDNFFYFALANTIFWCVASVVAYIVLEQLFQNKVWAFYAFLITLFNPFVLWYQQYAIPNISYTLFVWLTFIILHLITRSEFKKRDLVLVLLLLFCILTAGLIRISFLALTGSIFLYGIYRRSRILCAVSVLTVLIVVGAEWALATHGNQRSSFDIFLGVTRRQSGHDFSYLIGFSRMFISYLSVLVNFLLPMEQISLLKNIGVFRSGLVLHPALPLFGGLFLFGLYRKVRLHGIRVEDIFFVTHLCMISALVLKGIPQRYVLPILPLFVFYCCYGLMAIWASVTAWGKTCLCFVSLLFVAALLYSDVANSDLPRRRNFTKNVQTRELVQWIEQENLRFDTVGFFKPRLMVYLLDRRGVARSKRVVVIRSQKSAENFLHREKRSMVILHRGIQKDIIRELHEKKIYNELWRNKWYSVFARHRGG